MKKIMIIIAVFVMLANVASAFNMKLTNTTDKMLIARVNWLACDWEGFLPSVNMFIGEIQPGVTVDVGVDYQAGPWSVGWENDDFGVVYEFVVPSNRGTLISVPDATPVFHPGT